MTRASSLRSGSIQMVGTIGRPAASIARWYVLSMFQVMTGAGLSRRDAWLTRWAHHRKSRGCSV